MGFGWEEVVGIDGGIGRGWDGIVGCIYMGTFLNSAK